jgi:hypothetical protein
MTDPGVSFGYKPDLPDERDVMFASSLVSAPGATPQSGARVMAMDDYYFAIDQRRTESCTGHAVKQALRIWQLANLGAVLVEPSALGLYYNGRCFHPGMNEVDGGGYIRSTLKAVNTYGIVSQEHWPFASPKVNTRPSTQAELHAFKQRQVRYSRITGARLDQICESISEKRPCVLGIPVYREFIGNAGPDRIELPSGDPPILAWHAIEAHGFEVNGGLWLRIGNSWGADWRDGGRAFISAKYAARAIDAWSIDLVAPAT